MSPAKKGRSRSLTPSAKSAAGFGMTARVELEVEPVAEDHLRDQMVGCAGDPHAQTEIDFPLRRNVQINGGNNLVLLLRNGVESRDGPHRAVIFQPAGNLRSEVVAEFEIRREDNALVHALSVTRSVERGVDRPVPFPDLLVHDRADFPRPRVN